MTAAASPLAAAAADLVVELLDRTREPWPLPALAAHGRDAGMTAASIRAAVDDLARRGVVAVRVVGGRVVVAGCAR